MRKDREHQDLFRFTLICYAVFFVLVYFGSFSALLRNLQPYRYLTALFFLLTPAAGYGLGKVAQKFSGRAFSRALPVMLVILLFGLQFVPSYRLFYVVAPLTSKWPANVLELQDWLVKNTDLSGRIMMEDINKWEGKLAPYGPGRLPGLAPALIHRQLIGGPLPNAFIKHHYASFHDGLFLNKPIQEYTDQELQEKMSLYNIHWAVAWDARSKIRLEKFYAGRKAATFGGVEVFEIRNRPDWFLVGSGDLQADYDRIELRRLKPVNKMVVIKMHWLDGFQSEPACELFRFPVPGDPIGFIGLKNPRSELVLKYGR